MLADADGEWTEEMTMWMAPGAEPAKEHRHLRQQVILGGRYRNPGTPGISWGCPSKVSAPWRMTNAMKSTSAPGSTTWVPD